jgi:hypothetical protein
MRHAQEMPMTSVDAAKALLCSESRSKICNRSYLRASPQAFGAGGATCGILEERARSSAG